MSLQNMGVLLRAARREKVALGAFECWDSLNIQGIARAAKTCGAPVILTEEIAQPSIDERSTRRSEFPIVLA